MTKQKMPDHSILELAAEGTIAGMKDSHGDVSALNSLLRRTDAEGIRLDVFMGDPGLIVPAWTVGAGGTITAVANVVPRACQRIIAHLNDGALHEAMALQRELMKFVSSLALPTRATGRIPTLKFVMAEMGVIAHPRCASPFTPLTEDEKDYLRGSALGLAEALSEV